MIKLRCIFLSLIELMICIIYGHVMTNELFSEESFVFFNLSFYINHQISLELDKLNPTYPSRPSILCKLSKKCKAARPTIRIHMSVSYVQYWPYYYTSYSNILNYLYVTLYFIHVLCTLICEDKLPQLFQLLQIFTSLCLLILDGTMMICR